MIGAVVGNYEIEEEIGHGGMGNVYLGRHQILGRRAAIKVLLQQYSANEEMVSRIFNEARIAALIQHPGIVDVYEFGRLANGCAYVIMEYLEGETLGQKIDRDGAMPVDIALALTRQIAQAVGAAHGKDIIHRDLKPDNVFLVQDDEIACGLRARILDFGIAKLATGFGDSAFRTQTGHLMGTPIYMSPEQCRGAGKVDWRSDIYSLGVMLFEMLTGKVPFELEGTGEILSAHMYIDAELPSSFEPSVPSWLDAVVMKTLSKKPEERPQTMEELATLLGGRARTAPPPPSADSTRPRPSTTFRSSVGELTTPPLPLHRMARRVAIGVATVVVLVGAGLVMRSTFSSHPQEPPATSAPREVVVPAPVQIPAPPPAPPAPAATPPDAGAAPAAEPTEAKVEIKAAPPPRTPPRPPRKPRKPTPRRETLDPYGE